MKVLVDTGFLLSLISLRDKNNQPAIDLMRTLTENPVIAAPVLPELFHMVADRLRYRQAVALFDRLRGAAFHVEPLMAADMARTMPSPPGNRIAGLRIFMSVGNRLASSPSISI